MVQMEIGMARSREVDHGPAMIPREAGRVEMPITELSANSRIVIAEPKQNNGVRPMRGFAAAADIRERCSASVARRR